MYFLEEELGDIDPDFQFHYYGGAQACHSSIFRSFLILVFSWKIKSFLFFSNLTKLFLECKAKFLYYYKYLYRIKISAILQFYKFSCSSNDQNKNKKCWNIEKSFTR